MSVWLTPNARDDLAYWRQSEPATAQRLERLLDRLADGEKVPDLACTRIKFGIVSLMTISIAPEHRLVLEALGPDLIVHQCRFHY
jgi:toxin YoeB